MLDSLKALLKDQVKDLYSAESQLVKALPTLAKAASSDALRTAFESHLEETREHVKRLAQVAELLEVAPGGKKCKAMEGLVAEGAEVLEEEGDPAVIDAALISAARRVEHYEIAAYGSAIELAEQIGEDEIIKLLEQTLDEEGAADETLGNLAVDQVLPAAAKSEAAKPDQNGKTPAKSKTGRA